MNPILITALLLLAGDERAQPEAAAWIQSEALTVGEPLELVVRIDEAPDAPDEWWGDPAIVNVARPILQVSAPECVRLLGALPADKVSAYDFERSYLRFPYGRKLFTQETPIAFELTRAPKPDERIGLNLIYWIDNGDPERARFVRRRLELELAPGATAEPGDATNTAWGEHESLNVGDAADAFVLPSHDEFEIGLDEYRGGAALIVTYRAFW